MNLFTVENQRVTASPEALTIKEFKALWDRDSSKHKETAIEEFAYVFFMSDYKSVYMAYDTAAREQKIIGDVITKKSWKPGPARRSLISSSVRLRSQMAL